MQHGPLTADIARHETVEPELEEGRHADRRRGAEYEEQLPGGRHIELAQPQRHGQPQGEAQHEEVADGEDDALRVAAEADQPQRATCAPAPRASPSPGNWSRFNHQSLVGHRRLAQRARRPPFFYLRVHPQHARRCIPLLAIIAGGIKAVNRSRNSFG